MIPAWLDEETQALVADVLQTVQRWSPNHLLAIILYGSIARHDERPVDDPEPSDVDLLIIFNTDNPAMPYEWGMSAILGEAYRRHFQAPREVNVMFATRTLHEWDAFFLENVARDGILLYGELPIQLVSEHRKVG